MINILNNKNFDAYWLSYIGSHTDAGNRMCHYIGTSVGAIGGLLSFLLVGIFAGFIVIVVGYGIALAGHLIFQKNFPHSKKPHLGLVCDFFMLYLYCFNKLELKNQLNRIKFS